MPNLLQSNFAFPFRKGGESLELDFETDSSSGLPLLSETDEILKLVLTYLALPYSVVEYGCGKKTSLILRLLFNHGIPVQALSRGLIIERDLSPEALEEKDFDKRPHALTALNPLYQRADLKNPVLGKLLKEAGVQSVPEKGELCAGDFTLQHREKIQFVQARSHVFPCITAWDENSQEAVVRVVDPTLDAERLFPVEDMRLLLNAEEALILSGTMLGHFYLEPQHFTKSQEEAVAARLPEGSDLNNLLWKDQAGIVQDLLGAPDGSIGDPATWTYANNMRIANRDHQRQQSELTGSGDRLRKPIRDLIEGRKAHDEGAIDEALEKIDDQMHQLDLRRYLIADARWSENELRPLANLANTISYYLSIAALAERVSVGRDPLGRLDDGETQRSLHGLGVRLRGRIDDLAWHSSDPSHGIDARALNERFIAAAGETIRQMNGAGLAVFIDKVGNIHGLQLSQGEQKALESGSRSLDDFTSEAICHGSHIDTVLDAGKFDGRLGVLSGLEIAHALHDLERFYQLPFRSEGTNRRILVSAFMGEEMSFTGLGISMPGSSAINGFASPDDVHEMTNAEGERLGDRLVEFLRTVRRRRASGELQLAHPLGQEDADSLIDGCPDPRLFYTPHIVERHIEQGPHLDRHGVPFVIADRVMGIRQDDFRIFGPRAEAAGLAFIRRLRRLNEENRFKEVRVTAGIFQPRLEQARYLSPTFGLRWRLAGTVDHAGAISKEDRRDAGVAASMLAHEFFEHFEAENKEARPVLGSVFFRPGKNRNVIPGIVELTLGVDGPYSESEQTDLLQRLHAYAVSVLTDNVSAGGAGCSFCGVQSASFLNLAREVRLSLDLRAKSDEDIGAFSEAIDSIWEEILHQFNVEGQREPQQSLGTFDLSQTDQVLQLERSYGGSHNPEETELPEDLLTGTLLQLATTWDFLHDEIQGSVRELTKRRIPTAWRHRLENFTSGALHDSCNFAATVMQSI